ncbi:hypothetical protein GCM10014719_65590 [Planomonospora parontospora subsp. antibiotica]|nr:hypothetical protein GCM10014719_65590 [Planomonospora parontospora subsp. antibiotica]GII19785.1 hypothetical protein Ppa05_65110 [Planomonospora parontospora subsp. antibiotica]
MTLVQGLETVRVAMGVGVEGGADVGVTVTDGVGVGVGVGVVAEVVARVETLIGDAEGSCAFAHPAEARMRAMARQVLRTMIPSIRSKTDDKHYWQ